MFKLLNWYAVADPSNLTLVWDWNSYIVYRCLTGWIFLMKRALRFATKLNSRDIQKCNCFWVPSYDLFAFARKAVFSAGNGDRRSQIEKHVAVSVRNNLPLKSSTVLSEPKFGSPPPIKNSWIRPWGLWWNVVFRFQVDGRVYYWGCGVSDSYGIEDSGKLPIYPSP